MKVRVIIPHAPMPMESIGGRISEHEFPVLPAVGQLISFSDHLNGDYVVERVGFVQEPDGFIACVWTGPVDDSVREHGSTNGRHAENDRQFG
jgi:hypothetical protein